MAGQRLRGGPAHAHGRPGTRRQRAVPQVCAAPERPLRPAGVAGRRAADLGDRRRPAGRRRRVRSPPERDAGPSSSASHPDGLVRATRRADCLMPIAALLIDIDDTLLDDVHATRHGVAALLAAHALPYTLDEACDRWHSLTQQHWARFERGECSIIEQRHARLRGLFQRELSDDEANLALEPYIAGYRGNWKAFDDVAPFVAATAHLPRVLVRNGHLDIQQRKLAVTGLDAHFPH